MIHLKKVVKTIISRASFFWSGWLALSGLYLLSCDSGDIYPEEKRLEETLMNVQATFRFENDEAFPQNYRIIWGAFVGTSPYPLVFEEIAKPTGAIWEVTLLQTVPRGATHMMLALMEKGEKKIKYTFQEFLFNSAVSEMNITETVDLATFERVQAQIFTPQCIQCHGTGGLAADLDLTAGKAYAQLVGVPSNAGNSHKNRVTKHSLQNSFLIDVLTSRPKTVTTNHTTLSTLDAADDVALIRTWIMSENIGATASKLSPSSP